MKKLILFTNYYPYFKGEEYLETEIHYLTEEFDEIILFPTLLSDEMELTREVPNKVKVYPVYYQNTYGTKIKSLVNAVFSKDKEMHKRVKADAGSNIVRKLYDYYFEARTNEVAKEVFKALEKLEFNDDDQIYLYSYWLHATAKIAVEVKKQFFKGNVHYAFSRAHRYDVDLVASPIGFLPEREYLLDNLDQVYCISTNSQSYLQETYPKYKDKVSTARLGTSKTNEEAIAKNDPFVLVSCSLLRKVKNIDKIIDALAIIEQNHDADIEWIHFGNGPEFEKIKKVASEKLVKTKVSLPGYVLNKDVLKWYEEHQPSCFINVSSSEGIPVSIMEAMSFGIPVIATDVGGNGEIVQNRTNGLLLPDDVSTNMIAEAIFQLYNTDEAFYQNYKNNAYSTWKEQYSSDKNYTEFAALIANK